MENKKGVSTVIYRPPIWQDFLAGTFGGIMGVMVSFPFDTLKVRMQTQPNPPIYKGMIHCGKTMIADEGVKALYKGMLAPVSGAGAIKATLFASRRAIQTFLISSHPNTPLSIWELSIASCGAGFFASFVVTPVERVKVSLQASVNKSVASLGSFQCAKRLVATEGVFRGLFTGLTATVIREVPSYGVYFMSYEIGRRYFFKLQDGQVLQGPKAAVLGAIAGVLCWLPVYPIDVVKSKIQAGKGTDYKGIWDCTVKTWRAEGNAAFWRGMTPTLLRAIPCHAAVFAGYEFLMNIFRSLNK